MTIKEYVKKVVEDVRAGVNESKSPQVPEFYIQKHGFEAESQTAHVGHVRFVLNVNETGDVCAEGETPVCKAVFSVG
ncbi:MAG: hypothetical protein PWQ57_3399 [Desulfovibrionales bacterium]|nr:hypothetical protein [Desulfovibrionales bacterium]